MRLLSGVTGLVDLTGIFARSDAPQHFSAAISMARPEQRTRKREAAAKTCRKMDSWAYMVKPKLPKVEEELDGGGNIPVPREHRNGKK